MRKRWWIWVLVIALLCALVTDPNEAHVGIEFTCTYPFAGTYTEVNGLRKVDAYNCEVRVRAIDLVSGDLIAEAVFTNDLSDTINLSFVRETYYASIPYFRAPGSKNAATATVFLEEVAAFMEKPLLSMV